MTADALRPLFDRIRDSLFHANAVAGLLAFADLENVSAEFIGGSAYTAQKQIEHAGMALDDLFVALSAMADTMGAPPTTAPSPSPRTKAGQCVRGAGVGGEV